VVRQAVALGALLLAYLAAWIGGPWLAPLFRGLGLPDLLLAVVAGAAVAVAVFSGALLLSALVFKRTGQQGVAVVRVGFGLGGAALGLVSGLALVWLMLLGARLLGTVGEAEVAAAGPGDPPRPVAAGLAGVKHGIDDSVAGAVMQHVDPIPASAYAVLAKVTRVALDPKAGQRFFQYPGANELAHHPVLKGLLENPEVARLASERRFLALLRHPAVVGAANDAELGRRLRNFDLEKALDHALAPAQP
jgi:hypothetical protein